MSTGRISSSRARRPSAMRHGSYIALRTNMATCEITTVRAFNAVALTGPTSRRLEAGATPSPASWSGTCPTEAATPSPLSRIRSDRRPADGDVAANDALTQGPAETRALARARTSSGTQSPVRPMPAAAELTMLGRSATANRLPIGKGMLGVRRPLRGESVARAARIRRACAGPGRTAAATPSHRPQPGLIAVAH